MNATDRYFDPAAVRLGIIRENYSEVKIRSIGPLVERIRARFSHIIDDEPRRQLFFIPEEDFPRDERGDEMEIGLLQKRTGESKGTLSPLELVEGRTRNDSKKWRFHYGEGLFQRLPEEITRDYIDFFTDCRTLNDRARSIAVRVGQAFDKANAVEKNFPGSLADRIRRGTTLTRLLRYEDTKDTKLVLFDHQHHPIHGRESDPSYILVFPGTKFWGVTRGAFGTGTVHGVYSKQSAQFDASLHHDRSCLTVHWISKSDPNGQRFAAVTFVHCALTAEDVAWFDAHINDLKIERELYRL